MSTDVDVTRQNKTGIEGFQIRASVYNPNTDLFGGPKQPTKNQFVPRSPECPTLHAAKKLAKKWEDELYEQVHNPRKVVMLEDCFEELIKSSRNKSEIGKVKLLIKKIGHLPVSGNFWETLSDWANVERKRKTLVRKKGTKKEYVETSKTIAESTVRSYLHLCKTAIGKKMLAYPGLLALNPLAKQAIGRNMARKRPITEAEMAIIDDTIMAYAPYMMFPKQFARTNMIRPQDQFVLSQSQHVFRDYFNDTWKIEYMPMKTREQVNEPVFAHPVVFDELEPYFRSLHLPIVCDAVFTRPGRPQLKEDPRKIYPITQRHAANVWGTIIKKAAKKLPSVADIVWYDLRHHAVGELLKYGFHDVEIMDIAGWTSPEMIWRYYSRGRNLYLSTRQKMRTAQATMTVASAALKIP